MDPSKFAQMLADGTDAVEDMVRKIKRKLDHGEELSNADLMNGYTKVYDLCSGCPLKLKPILVIPSLENKEDEALVWERFNSTIQKAIRDLIASGWPWDLEEEPGLPSYDQLSDFIKESDSRLVSIEEKFEELMSHFSKTS